MYTAKNSVFCNKQLILLYIWRALPSAQSRREMRCVQAFQAQMSWGRARWYHRTKGSSEPSLHHLWTCIPHTDLHYFPHAERERQKNSKKKRDFCLLFIALDLVAQRSRRFIYLINLRFIFQFFRHLRRIATPFFSSTDLRPGICHEIFSYMNGMLVQYFICCIW